MLRWWVEQCFVQKDLIEKRILYSWWCFTQWVCCCLASVLCWWSNSLAEERDHPEPSTIAASCGGDDHHQKSDPHKNRADPLKKLTPLENPTSPSKEKNTSKLNSSTKLPLWRFNLKRRHHHKSDPQKKRRLTPQKSPPPKKNLWRWKYHQRWR